MLQPTLPGWKIETVGDDIAWLRVGNDGQLYAVNPENGFFGVAPGTSLSSNPNAMKSISQNTLFTNVALTDDGDVWWEGMTKEKPKHLIDWKGNDWTPESDVPSSHPNSRFTVPISQCPTIDSEWENPDGVPISAILFGGRRQTNVPLVLESFNWTHGAYMGASISSEQTAAAEGVVGALRHDPFAMLPFCGYNMADYFGHWVNMRNKASRLPKIYTVNWFRKNYKGDYMWPGFGENIRVLEWIFNRTKGNVSAQETPLGYIPKYGDINLPDGFKQKHFDSLFEIKPQNWKDEMKEIRSYFSRFSNLPPEFLEQISKIETRLDKQMQKE